MSGAEIIILNRDVVAVMVPSGARLVLQRGTEVKIMQNKGDNYTVEAFGNLAMIAGTDADSLGKVPVDILSQMPPGSTLEDQAWFIMKTIYDPEIPVNIVDLGLIYQVNIKSDDTLGCQIEVTMTLTAPGCGMGPVIASEVETKLLLLPEVEHVLVTIVFEPLWHQGLMSEAAQLELGMFD